MKKEQEDIFLGVVCIMYRIESIIMYLFVKQV